MKIDGILRFVIERVGQIGWLLVLLSLQSGVALANHQVDEIEAALSEEVADQVAQRLGEPLSEEDQAYAYFLMAAYRHDPSAREKAEALYEGLNTADSLAFLGSLEMLKARDLEGGLFQLFKRKRWVQKGIEKIDAAADTYPDNLKVRIVRAISYLGLPALFGKFEEGFADINRILREMEAGTVSVPEEEPFFRDRASLYYYAGRYYLRKGEKKKAGEMFSKAAGSALPTPFAAASRKRISGLS